MMVGKEACASAEAQGSCTPECKKGADAMIASLDGSCCDRVDAEADGISPETCRAMMSSQVVPKLKQWLEVACPDDRDVKLAFILDNFAELSNFKTQEKSASAASGV